MTQTLTDKQWLLQFGDMLSDDEIRSALNRMSSKDRAAVYRSLKWLSEGPPWAGYVTQGPELIWLKASANGEISFVTERTEVDS
jgi:hypothetical protein